MSVEGLWSTEVFGLWGWENRGVLVLCEGRALGGGNNHCTVGQYTLENDTISAALEVRYHGATPTMFGSSNHEFTLQVHGRVEDQHITGEIHRADRPELRLAIRLTRRAELAETDTQKES